MKKILPLWFVIFISFFCYSSMLTMFVPLLQDHTSPMYNANYSSAQTNILCGLFLALYPLGQFLGSPIIGALSDRLGRKRMLIISLTLSIACFLFIGY
jgi:MFS family permease